MESHMHKKLESEGKIKREKDLIIGVFIGFIAHVILALFVLCVSLIDLMEGFNNKGFYGFMISSVALCIFMLIFMKERKKFKARYKAVF